MDFPEGTPFSALRHEKYSEFHPLGIFRICSSDYVTVPQWEIGSPHRRPGPPWDFWFWGNPCKTAPWEGLGGNWPTQKVPGYHTNHSPRKKSGETSWGTNPSTNLFFRVPFWAQKGPPGPPGPRCGVGAPKCGVMAPKMGSRVKNIKVAY